MSQSELLNEVLQVLTELKVPYMLTGSLVSSFQGGPRSTHDYDIVVRMAVDEGMKLCERFQPPRYYLDQEAVRSGILQKAEFSLTDNQSGFKIDFWPLRSTAFDQSCFRRRVPEEIFGRLALISAPEDTILNKLRCARESGGSERQHLDALKVYEVQFSGLDHSYLNKWAAELGIENELDEIKSKAKPVG
ncbi:MAG: hypothetical protein ACR2IE_18320 [Candidatus Sumerlaeaceae bacterium]